MNVENKCKLGKQQACLRSKRLRGYLLSISSSPKKEIQSREGKTEPVQIIHCPEKRKNSNTETGDSNMNVQNNCKRIKQQACLRKKRLRGTC